MVSSIGFSSGQRHKKTPIMVAFKVFYGDIMGTYSNRVGDSIELVHKVKKK